MLADPHAWIAFITLSALEIVLGIDNIIFISILVSRLQPERREAARITGLALAMLTRIALLFSIVWLTRLTKPVVLRPRTGVLGPRHHPVVRRPVPAGEERHRDPRHARGRGRGTSRESLCELHRHRGADRPHRHRVLAGLGVHGGGPRQTRSAAHHGRGHRAGHRRDDVGVGRRSARSSSVTRPSRSWRWHSLFWWAWC